MNDHEVFLSTREAAAFLRLSPQTLANWRAKRFGPAYHKFGRRVRYKMTDLERFTNSRKIQLED